MKRVLTAAPGFKVSKSLSLIVLLSLILGLVGCAGKTSGRYNLKNRNTKQELRDFLNYTQYIAGPVYGKLCAKHLPTTPGKMKKTYKKWTIRHKASIDRGRSKLLKSLKGKGRKISDFEAKTRKNLEKKFHSRKIDQQKKACLGHLYLTTL